VTLHEGMHAGTQPARAWVPDQELLDFDLLQTGHNKDTFCKITVSNISATRSMSPARPVICGEVAYEGHCDRPERNSFNNHDDTPPFPQRFLFWTSMLQGAAGHTYGANGIWQVESPEHPHGWSGTCTENNFWETSWVDTMHYLGSKTLPLGKKLLERYAWWRFEPHQDWVEPAGTSFTKPHFNWDYNPFRKFNRMNGNPFLSYAAGIPGEVRVIYIPYGAPAPKVLEIRAKNYRAFYFNPLDGTEHDLGRVKPKSRAWQAPDVPSRELDWILVLEKTGR